MYHLVQYVEFSSILIILFEGNNIHLIYLYKTGKSPTFQSIINKVVCIMSSWLLMVYKVGFAWSIILPCSVERVISNLCELKQLIGLPTKSLANWMKKYLHFSAIISVIIILDHTECISVGQKFALVFALGQLAFSLSQNAF